MASISGGELGMSELRGDGNKTWLLKILTTVEANVRETWQARYRQKENLKGSSKVQVWL